MVVHSDLSRIKTLLTEALTVLCKNGLKYRSELCIEGLLGITLDNQDIFLVNINEKLIQNEDGGENNKSTVTDQRKGNTINESYSRHEIASSSSKKTDINRESQKENHQNFHSVNTEELFRKSGHAIESSQPENHAPSKYNGTEVEQIFPYSNGGRSQINDKDSNSNPLDLIIKRETLSDGEAVEEIGEISRLFNLSRPVPRINTRNDQGVAPVTIQPEKTDSSSDVEVNSMQDTKALSYDDTNDKVSETAWTSGLVPYCSSSNLVTDPHFFALAPSPLTQAFPLFSPSLINQYNIGIQIPAMDNPLSQSTPSRPPVLSAGRNLVCQFCAKVVRTNQALRDHIATHEQRKRYQCQNCELQFVHRSSLANHRRKCFPSVSTMQAEWFRPKEEKT